MSADDLCLQKTYICKKTVPAEELCFSSLFQLFKNFFRGQELFLLGAFGSGHVKHK